MFAKYQGVFRSRWKALWWAAGILLTAYCTVPSADEVAKREEAAKAPPQHVNPWSVDQKKK